MTSDKVGPNDLPDGASGGSKGSHRLRCADAALLPAKTTWGRVVLPFPPIFYPSYMYLHVSQPLLGNMVAPASFDADYHFSFSLAVLGEARSGKSKLINCTLPEAASAENEAAGAGELGVDHGVRCKAHTYESRGARYQILMWEVPGAPRYLDVAARYASMAAGLLLVFDLTRRSTFERIPLWLEAVEATSPELPRVLVGNKSDGETQVSAEEAVALAQKHGCKCMR